MLASDPPVPNGLGAVDQCPWIAKSGHISSSVIRNVNANQEDPCGGVSRNRQRGADAMFNHDRPTWARRAVRPKIGCQTERMPD